MFIETLHSIFKKV